MDVDDEYGIVEWTMKMFGGNDLYFEVYIYYGLSGTKSIELENFPGSILQLFCYQNFSRKRHIDFPT